MTDEGEDIERRTPEGAPSQEATRWEGTPPQCRHVLPVLYGKVWATRKAKIKPICVGLAGADRAMGPPPRLRRCRGMLFNRGAKGRTADAERSLEFGELVARSSGPFVAVGRRPTGPRMEAGAGPLASASPTPRATSRRRSSPSGGVQRGGDDARSGDPRGDRSGPPADASVTTGLFEELSARQGPSTVEQPLGAPANGAQGRCSRGMGVPEEGLEPSRPCGQRILNLPCIVA